MIRFSIDDGCKDDLQFMNLCLALNYSCTFYIPVEMHSLAYEHGYTPLSYQDVISISKNFRIGSHTITHRHLTKMFYKDACYEIKESKYMLEKMYDIDIDSFAPPRGYTNDILTKFANQYYTNIRLTRGDNLVHIHPDSGANGNRKWQDVYKEKAPYGDVELWGHTWEFNKYDMWQEISEFMESHAHSQLSTK